VLTLEGVLGVSEVRSDPSLETLLLGFECWCVLAEIGMTDGGGLCSGDLLSELDVWFDPTVRSVPGVDTGPESCSKLGILRSFLSRCVSVPVESLPPLTHGGAEWVRCLPVSSRPLSRYCSFVRSLRLLSRLLRCSLSAC